MSRSGRRYGILLGLAARFVSATGQALMPASMRRDRGGLPKAWRRTEAWVSLLEARR